MYRGVHFRDARSIDLGRDGIRCNAIAPGWINSALSDAYLAAQVDPRAVRQASHSLLGRFVLSQAIATIDHQQITGNVTGLR